MAPSASEVTLPVIASWFCARTDDDGWQSKIANALAALSKMVGLIDRSLGLKFFCSYAVGMTPNRRSADTFRSAYLALALP
jgi:hypothetical protein